MHTARCLCGPKDGEMFSYQGESFIWIDWHEDPSSRAADGYVMVRHEYRFQTLVLLDGSPYDCWVYAGVIGTPAHGEASLSARPREETQMQMKPRARVEAVVVRMQKRDACGNEVRAEKELIKVDLGYVVGTQPMREDVLRMPEVVKACMDGDVAIPGSELEVAFARVNFCM